MAARTSEEGARKLGARPCFRPRERAGRQSRQVPGQRPHSKLLVSHHTAHRPAGPGQVTEPPAPQLKWEQKQSHGLMGVYEVISVKDAEWRLTHGGASV